MRNWFVVLAMVALGACSSSESAIKNHIVVSVVSDQSGTPIPGEQQPFGNRGDIKTIQVRVGDQAWVTPGADGKATFDVIPEPYTILVRESRRYPNGIAPADTITMLTGQTGREVAVEVSSNPKTGWGAGVTGTVQPLSGDAGSVAQLVHPLKDGGYGGLASSDGSFDIGVVFDGGSPSITAKLRGWETDGAMPPGHYFGFGSVDVPVTQAETVSGVTLPLQTVTEGTVEVTFSVPAGYPHPGNIRGVDLLVAFGPYDSLHLGLVENHPSAEPLAVVLPSVPGGETWLRFVTGPGEHRVRVDVPSSGKVIDFAPEPQLLEPAPDATIGEGTVFRWSPPEAGGTSTVYVYCSWTDPVVEGGVAAYDLRTDASEVTLPAVEGFTVPAGATCSWMVNWCADLDPASEELCVGSAENSATW